jgi:hypothetical protein
MATGAVPDCLFLATGARPVESLTYAEIAERFGLEREAARQLVKRRRWPKWKGNDGQVRVSVPEDVLSDRSETGPPQQEPGSEPVPDPVFDMSSVLSRHIERLEARFDAIRQELRQEIETLKQQRDTAAARAVDRDILAVQLDALKAALDAANQDRDRWHAAAAARRSWWPWRRSA